MTSQFFIANKGDLETFLKGENLLLNKKTRLFRQKEDHFRLYLYLYLGLLKRHRIR